MHSQKELSLNFQNKVFTNLTREELSSHAQNQDMVVLSKDGAIVATTGQYTGRDPENRYIVKNSGSEGVDFGAVNRPFDADEFEKICTGVMAYLETAPTVYVQNSYAGADERYRLNVALLSESAWHTAIAKNMFIDIADNEVDDFDADYTILHAPFFNPKPLSDSLPNEACVLIDLEQHIVIIAGTEYAGEIKKSIFSVMNFILPQDGVMPMHCSANMDKSGIESAVFFGLSGTGKTTLSADSTRILIGDDEHGWTDTGVFNFEGGCYAKATGVTAESEPEIFAATKMAGTILENIVLDKDGVANFEDTSLTKNTRISYPVSSIDNASETGVGALPKNVIMLTCDAFGVLPPVSKLTKEQAAYHFLSGYTAKVAGTEIGVTDPQATFSACFGAPFMPMHPTVYGKLFQKMMDTHDTRCWLVNTGWIGGSYGTGSRIKLKHTRAIIAAILNGELEKSTFETDAIFGLSIPQFCEGVDDGILNPTESWADKKSYRVTADKLFDMFEENFKNFL